MKQMWPWIIAVVIALAVLYFTLQQKPTSSSGGCGVCPKKTLANYPPLNI